MTVLRLEVLQDLSHINPIETSGKLERPHCSPRWVGKDHGQNSLFRFSRPRSGHRRASLYMDRPVADPLFRRSQELDEFLPLFNGLVLMSVGFSGGITDIHQCTRPSAVSRFSPFHYRRYGYAKFKVFMFRKNTNVINLVHR